MFRYLLGAMALSSALSILLTSRLTMEYIKAGIMAHASSINRNDSALKYIQILEVINGMTLAPIPNPEWRDKMGKKCKWRWGTCMLAMMQLYQI